MMQNDFPRWQAFLERMKERRIRRWRVELIKWLHGAYNASERVIKREGRVIWLMSRGGREKQGKEQATCIMSNNKKVKYFSISLEERRGFCE